MPNHCAVQQQQEGLVLQSCISFAEQANKFRTKRCLQKPRILKRGSAQRAEDGRRLRKQEGRDGVEGERGWGGEHRYHVALSLSLLLCEASHVPIMLFNPSNSPCGGYYFPHFPLRDFRPNRPRIGIQISPFLPEIPTQSLDFTTSNSKGFFIHSELK